jgi:hypothetical protein
VDLLDEGARGLRAEAVELVDVGAAAEGAAVAAEDHDPDRSFQLFENRMQFIQMGRVQRIDLLGAVEEDARDPFLDPHLDAHALSL